MRCIALVLVGMAVAVGSVHATCYTVYDAAGAMVFRDSQSPVDLRMRIGDSVPGRFGAGATMVMVPDGGPCEKAGVAGVDAPFSGSNWAHLEWGMATEQEGSIHDGGVLSYGGSIVQVPGRLGYPYVGPRGGHFRYTAGGNRVYGPRGR